MAKPLPQDLTSYDFLKTLAVVLMIVDHVGHFFFPDDMWFRVIGRLCVPVWFFLIGYARTREIPRIMWIGGSVMVLSAVAAGEYLLPLNILFTMAAVRLLIDRVMFAALHPGRGQSRDYEPFLGMFAIMFLLAYPSSLLLEYGTLGMLFSMIGFMARNRAHIHGDMAFHPRAAFFFVLAASVTYVIYQSLMLPTLSAAQLCAFAARMAAVMALLRVFRPQTYPNLTGAVPGPLAALLRLTGRRTLEIYVLHVVAFRIIAIIWFPDRFPLFEWEISPVDIPALFSLS